MVVDLPASVEPWNRVTVLGGEGEVHVVDGDLVPMAPCGLVGFDHLNVIPLRVTSLQGLPTPVGGHYFRLNGG
jgi:hypothetical protein